MSKTFKFIKTTIIKWYEDIKERYNNPTEEMKRVGIKPGSGREKIFEVRELD